MARIGCGIRWNYRWSFGMALLMLGGCQQLGQQSDHVDAVAPPQAVESDGIPRELNKVILPPYVIESPDLLMIDAIHIVPKQPYRLRPFDVLSIQVQGAPADAPISGIFPIGADGKIVLGPLYGSLQVAGLTFDEVQPLIKKYLQSLLKNPEVAVNLADTATKQQIAGQHLVGPDGTVTLGSYGSVLVVGLTVRQAKWTIEQYLGQYLESPEISVEVAGYNSKVFYIVTQGAGLGDGVYRFPITGNETVLDAISQINGLQPVASKQIWVARPTNVPGRVQRLPVSWEDITANANASSNYQLLPGDRVFIAADKWIAFDTALGKFIAPMDRVLGFSLLGVGTVTRFSGPVLKGGGNRQGDF
jgi:polysaccharide export outer membrane protein